MKRVFFLYVVLMWLAGMSGAENTCKWDFLTLFFFYQQNYWDFNYSKFDMVNVG